MTDLGELGLSSYEETAYRALLSLGSATAREVAETSGVPRGRVYDVLNGLEARELVRTSETEPTTYAAVEPTTAVDRLLAERERQLEARAERYAAIADRVGSELTAATPTESRFWTAPLGSETAVTLVREVFESADGLVRSAMSVPYAAAPTERYEPEVGPFFAALDDDLTVECLVAAEMVERLSADEAASWDVPPSVDVRVTTDLRVSFDRVDESRVCFHVPHPTTRGERLGVIDVRDDELADRLDETFDSLWTDAVPVSTIAETDELRAAFEAIE